MEKEYRIPMSFFRDEDPNPNPFIISDIENQEENHTKIVLEESLDNPVLEESLDNPVLEESLNNPVLEETFQKKLQGLVKKKQERYEQTKPTYHVQDQNYRFHQEYVVTLAKYYNIPIPTLDSNLEQRRFTQEKTLR